MKLKLDWLGGCMQSTAEDEIFVCKNSAGHTTKSHGDKAFPPHFVDSFLYTKEKYINHPDQKK